MLLRLTFLDFVEPEAARLTPGLHLYGYEYSKKALILPAGIISWVVQYLYKCKSKTKARAVTSVTLQAESWW